MEKRTQKQKILDHFEIAGSITSIEAVERYGIMRLQARIHELGKSGVEIVGITEQGKNRYGEPVKYKRYMLK